MAGVELGDIDRHFAWQAWLLWHWAGSGDALGFRLTPLTPQPFASQAWHLVTSTATLRGRRETYRIGLALVARLVPVCRRGPAALCVAGVALGDIHRHFAWQEWRLVTSSLCVAGVALMALGWLW